MLTNFLFSLLLVGQMGSSGYDAVNGDWNLGEFQAPAGFRVIPEELVIDVDKAGSYKFQVEIANYTNGEVNFDVYYCPENIKLSGLRGKSIGRKTDGKFTATLEVSDGDWQGLLDEAMKQNKRDPVTGEVKSKPSPGRADAITKIGAMIRDSKGNEIGVMEIPVFIRHLTEPGSKKAEQAIDSQNKEM